MTLKKIKIYLVYLITGIVLILSLYWVYWQSRYEMTKHGDITVLYDKWRNEYHKPKQAVRFIANVNGTVLDRQTGLMWAAQDNGSDINWTNAKSY
jgi:hypothetical protein